VSSTYPRPGRERDRVRSKRLTAEEWAESLAGLKARQERDQQITMEAATDSRRYWTQDEDLYILDHLDVAARDVALALGRTMWGVTHRRSRLLRGLVKPGERARTYYPRPE
jgi:hypothetical protein